MQSSSAGPVTIEKTILLNELPSGSGIAIVADAIYIVGDDSPYLFQLSADYTVVKRYLLLNTFSTSERITKKDKPDFESITHANWLGQPSLLIFGSGSQSPERDLLLTVSLQQPGAATAYSITPFYNAIAAAAGLDRRDMNIEGAVTVGSELWLFNRGRNEVLVVDWQEFSSYIQQAGTAISPPAIQHYPVSLPQLKGKQARFSGACQLPGTDKILFTATVEDTDNWIDDGEILGSYVGLLDAQQLQRQTPEHCWLVTDAKGETPKDKLESIDVLLQSGNTITALAITDNDNGSSVLVELLIKLE